jgi:hypothetical protein
MLTQVTQFGCKRLLWFSVNWKKRFEELRSGRAVFVV